MVNRTYSLHDIFGVARDVPLNYVTRDEVDNVLVDALTQNKHIVVHGSSKQGKTSLRKSTLEPGDYIYVTCSNRWNLSELHNAVLKSAGYKVEGSTNRTTSGALKVHASLQGTLRTLFAGAKAEAGAAGEFESSVQREEKRMELDSSDVNDIITALDEAEAPKFIVLEDFHYLPEDTQKDFAVALKAFHENSNYSFVIIGVWLDENRLTQHNGDLSGRVLSVNADKWEREYLRAVINSGADLLNIRFEEAFVEDLISGAFDSVWIVQEVCKFACEDAGVYRTLDSARVVGGSAADLIRKSVDQSSARFNGFLSSFADGFQSTDLEMYRWLLYAVLRSSLEEIEKGLSLATITQQINSAHPSAPVNQGNITQALRSTSSLQTSRLAVKPIILDYHQTARRLNAVDRSFLIWLQHQDRPALAEELGLPRWED